MKMTSKYENKKVLVMGLAKSGKAAARLLKKLKAEVVINDFHPLEINSDATEMIAEGFEVVTGGHPLELLDQGFDFIVKNPGIPYRKVPLLMEAIKRKIPILTEVQLAYDISEAPFIGITATNGKTTTTTLIYEMLEEGQLNPLIAGNIGEVASLVAENATKEQVLVTELSSFQLMGIDSFTPQISLLLNITEAHLDYHTDIEEYRQAKLNLIANQTPDQFCVYNAEDEVIVKGLSRTKATCVPFALTREVDGAYIFDGHVCFKGEKIIEVDSILLKGDHNLQDVLGAVAVSKLYGCSTEAIQRVLKRFVGVKHRLQYVDEINGVTYYNNSKATNVIATQTALKAFDDSIILLAGGLDRQHDLHGIVPYFSKIKAIIAFGETKYRFKELADEEQIPCVVVETLDEAVKEAAQLATVGDRVLLSPACASWDQYPNFETRGDHFIELVEQLKNK
ncbi:MAG: UDP-N-acetylmuramoyl-L-alanine--D-glutamate ligase [Turicibacter sp.]|nr:UDP-N-acetylmuramoyl-L-alanine--D-glutamate ligase [Turicibacter sp.]